MLRYHLIAVPDAVSLDELRLVARALAHLAPEEKALLLEAMRLRMGLPARDQQRTEPPDLRPET